MDRRLEDTAKLITVFASSAFNLDTRKPVPSYSWSFDEKLTNVGNELLNGTAKRLGTDVLSYGLSHGLDQDACLSPNLLTRKSLRKVATMVIECLLAKGPSSRAVVLGAPGIGKTRGGLGEILRPLLKRGERVMYAARKYKVYTLYELGEDGSYCAKSCECDRTTPTFEVGPDDWILVDPDEDGNDIKSVKGRLVLAASPNRKHYHNWGKMDAEFFYVCAWTFEEILTVRDELNTEKLNDATLFHRFQCVGGAPRYLFSTKQFDERVTDMKTSGNRLDSRQVWGILNGDPANEIEERGRHLSTLFMTYEKQDDDDDGEISILNPKVTFVSRYSKYWVIQHVFKSAFDSIVNEKDRKMNSFRGAGFEDLVSAYLMLGGTLNRKKLVNGKEEKIKTVKFENADVYFAQNQASVFKELGKRRDSDGKQKQRVVTIAPESFAVIDFMDSSGLLFNATLDMSHKIAVGVAVDSLKRIINARPHPSHPLHLHWCLPDVPEFRNKFKKRPLAKELDTVVKQYALFIPKAPSPETLELWASRRSARQMLNLVRLDQ